MIRKEMSGGLWVMLFVFFFRGDLVNVEFGWNEIIMSLVDYMFFGVIMVSRLDYTGF